MVIFLLLMLALWLGGIYLFWAIAGSQDHEGDYLWLALTWTCLGWLLPALAVLRLVSA